MGSTRRPLAQLVELPPLKRKVPGSSPGRSTRADDDSLAPGPLRRNKRTSSQAPSVQPGVDASLSRRRSRVRIPYGARPASVRPLRGVPGVESLGSRGDSGPTYSRATHPPTSGVSGSHPSRERATSAKPIGADLKSACLFGLREPQARPYAMTARGRAFVYLPSDRSAPWWMPSRVSACSGVTGIGACTAPRRVPSVASRPLWWARMRGTSSRSVLCMVHTHEQR